MYVLLSYGTLSGLVMCSVEINLEDLGVKFVDESSLPSRASSFLHHADPAHPLALSFWTMILTQL